MEVTREYVVGQIAEFEAAQAKMLADYNALSGAIQSMRLVLARLDEGLPDDGPARNGSAKGRGNSVPALAGEDGG